MQNLQKNNDTLATFITDLQSGSRPRGGVRGIASGIPSVGGEHLNNFGSFDFASVKYVSAEFAKSMSKGQIQTDDILVVKDGATTGKVSFVDSSFPFKEATINEHVFIVRVNERILPKFLFWYLWSSIGQKEILKNFQGSAQGGINRTFIDGVSVPVLSIEMQEKLLNRIEQTVPRTWQNKKKLENTKKILANFCQSILTTAITGELTKEWRKKNQKVEPAAKLFERIKIERKVRSKAPTEKVNFSNLPSLPETWLYVFFGDIVNDFKYGTSEKSDYSYKGTPVLRIPNVISQKISTADLKYLLGSLKGEECLVKKGDILIVRSNGSRDLVGKNAMVDELVGDYAFASYLIRIRPVLVEPGFLSILLNSDLGRRQLFSNAKSAAGINNINTQELASMIVPLPPIEEQKEIVKKVNEYFEIEERVKKQIGISEAKVSKLTQAFLTKTFNRIAE